MVMCSVYGCSSRKDQQNKSDFKFHRYPKDPVRREAWLNVVKIKTELVPASVLCSKHFSPGQINDTYASGPRLKENAVPDLFVSVEDLPEVPTATKKKFKKIKTKTSNINYIPRKYKPRRSKNISEINSFKIELNEDSIVKFFFCKICCEVCDDEERLIQHVKENHGFVEESYSDSDDNETLADIRTKFLIKLAKQCDVDSSESNGLPNTHKCKLCDLVFTSKKRMSDHVRIHSEEQKNQELFLHCNDCDHKFVKKSEVLMHMQTHIKVAHTCEYCEKTFPLAISYRKHMQQHEGEDPFKCEYCVENFSKKLQYYAHIISHTQITNRRETLVKPEVVFCDSINRCHLCTRIFSKKKHLTSHVRDFHDGGRPFTCQKCDECFSIEAHLVYHLGLHDSMRQYLCDSCGENFHDKATILKHLRVHAKKQPSLLTSPNSHHKKVQKLNPKISHARVNKNSRTCKECGKVYKKLSKFMDHMKMHKPQHQTELAEMLEAPACTGAVTILPNSPELFG